MQLSSLFLLFLHLLQLLFGLLQLVILESLRGELLPEPEDGVFKVLFVELIRHLDLEILSDVDDKYLLALKAKFLRMLVEDIEDLLEGLIVVHHSSVLGDIEAVILELELDVAALDVLLQYFEQLARVFFFDDDHGHVFEDLVDRLKLGNGARVFAGVVQGVAKFARRVKALPYVLRRWVPFFFQVDKLGARVDNGLVL